jgi:type II secretory pathway pseudopilin PulG
MSDEEDLYDNDDFHDFEEEVEALDLSIKRAGVSNVETLGIGNRPQGVAPNFGDDYDVAEYLDEEYEPATRLRTDHEGEWNENDKANVTSGGSPPLARETATLHTILTDYADPSTAVGHNGTKPPRDEDCTDDSLPEDIEELPLDERRLQSAPGVSEQLPVDHSKLTSLKQKSLSKRKQALLDDISSGVPLPSPDKETAQQVQRQQPHSAPEETISPRKKQIGLINSKFQAHNRILNDSSIESAGSTADGTGGPGSLKHTIQSEFAKLGLEALSPVAGKVSQQSVQHTVEQQQSQQQQSQQQQQQQQVALRRKAAGVGATTAVHHTTTADTNSTASSTGAPVRNAYGRVLPLRKGRMPTEPAVDTAPEKEMPGMVEVDVAGPDEGHQLSAAKENAGGGKFSSAGKWGKVPQASKGVTSTAQPERNHRVSLKPSIPPRKVRPTPQTAQAGPETDIVGHVDTVESSGTRSTVADTGAERAAPGGGATHAMTGASTASKPAAVRHAGRSFVPSVGAQTISAQARPVPPAAPKPSVPKQPARPLIKKAEAAEPEAIISDLLPASVLEENSTYLSLLEAAASESRRQVGEGTVSTVKLIDGAGSEAVAQTSPSSHSKKARFHARFADDDHDEYSDAYHVDSDHLAPPLSAPSSRPPQQSPGHYAHPPQSSRSQPDHHATASANKRPQKGARQPQRTLPHSPYHSAPLKPKTKQQLKQQAGGGGNKTKKLHKGRDWMAVSLSSAPLYAPKLAHLTRFDVY